MNVPVNLKYSKEHEWVKLTDGIATIGITEHAHSQLGEIIFVDIQTEGETLEQHEVFGAIEAVKTVADAFMPIAGEIIEVNSALEKSPELVNKDPYEAGWMIKVRVSQPSDYENLMSADEYIAFIS